MHMFLEKIGCCDQGAPEPLCVSCARDSISKRKCDSELVMFTRDGDKANRRRMHCCDGSFCHVSFSFFPWLCGVLRFGPVLVCSTCPILLLSGNNLRGS